MFGSLDVGFEKVGEEMKYDSSMEREGEGGGFYIWIIHIYINIIRVENRLNSGFLVYIQY